MNLLKKLSGRHRVTALASACALAAGGLIGITATPAQAQTACQVNYQVAWSGGNGFGANVTIQNLGSAINGGWTLTFTFPGNQQIGQGWVFVWSQSGANVTATNESWNANIPAGGQISGGFNGTVSGTNAVPTSFSLNGVACTGQVQPPPPGPSPTPPPPGPGPQPPQPPPPGNKVDNPYAGADVYVNPDWSAAAQAGGAPASVYNQPTGVWLDRRAAITAGSAGSNTLGLADHLDNAVAQDQANGSTPLVFQVVIYNLPGRDCAALASNGELGPTDINTYRTEYIDVIRDIMDDPAYANLRIAAIIEIDSLPNLVTNVSPRATSTPECDVMLANQNYQNGVAYAVAQLGSLANVYNYIDAGHHGWIGWTNTDPQFDNFNAAARMFASILGREGATAAHVHGFITNTANYSVLAEPYLDLNTNVGGTPVRQSAWVDWNDYLGELAFAQNFRSRLVQEGFNSGVGMLIDTSRNGWGGPDRPTGSSSATDVNQYVVESRTDRRLNKGNWCNQAGAGLGERPQASPASGIDAYVWIKPPGESDGSSSLIPNDEGKGFDRMCDPTFTEGTPRNNNNPSGALPNAPISGHWFQAQFEELMANAWPPLS